MRAWNKSEYADRIRQAVQIVLTQNRIAHTSFIVSMSATSAAGSFRWAVVALTSRGKLAFDLETTAFDPDASLTTKVAEAVNGVLPPVVWGQERKHDLIYCWCGHSGDSPETEMGWHALERREIAPRLFGSELRCKRCDREQPPREERQSRPGPMRCPACISGYVGSTLFGAPRELCPQCNGMGYLKPAWYEEASRQPVS
jgi:hypothetical protein